jgi:hypothetical protein
MVDDLLQKQTDQLALLMEVLDRPDLTRQQRVVFLDMRVAMGKYAMVLSDAQEGWLQSVKDQPLPDLTKVEVVEVPAMFRPMTRAAIVGWVVGTVLAIFLFQLLLTSVLGWLGWR